MRAVLFVMLAERACAALSLPNLCLWRPPPPQLVCGIDEIQEQFISDERIAKEFKGNQAASGQPPSRWDSTGRCADHFCIYANHGFAGGRGMVTITTNSNLKRLKKMFDDPNAHGSSLTAPPPFHLAEIKGKGLGLVANTTLRRGDRLMQVPPAVLIHRSFLEELPAHAQIPLLEAAVTQLPAPLQQAFLSQMSHSDPNHEQHEYHSLAHKISAILATNSFQLDLGGGGGLGGQHYANYPHASRFNHDCRPNVVFHLDPRTLAHTTTVVRDVQPGEELAISYLDSLEPRAARQARAQQVWGFKCSCAQCMLGEKEAAKSDRRVQEILQIERKLEDISSKGVNGKLLERLVRLYQEESLDAKVAGAYTLVALNYNMLGDAKKAGKYAKLAHEAVVMERGETAGDAEAMRVLAENPKGHFTWRRRLQR